MVEQTENYIVVKVKAGAKKDEVISYEPEYDGGEYILKVSVKQVPEHGKANGAIIKLISKKFGIKQSDIQIISGHKNNRKVLKLPFEIKVICV